MAPLPSMTTMALDMPPPGRCLWPHGDPRQPGFRWCGKPAAGAGQPYCAEHETRARNGGAKPATAAAYRLRRFPNGTKKPHNA